MSFTNLHPLQKPVFIINVLCFTTNRTSRLIVLSEVSSDFYETVRHYSAKMWANILPQDPEAVLKQIVAGRKKFAPTPAVVNVWAAFVAQLNSIPVANNQQQPPTQDETAASSTSSSPASIVFPQEEIDRCNRFIKLFHRACQHAILWLIRQLFIAWMDANDERAAALIDVEDALTQSTALHHACKTDQPDVISLLLEYSSDQHALLTRSQGLQQYPLTIAVVSGAVNVVKYLMKDNPQYRQMIGDIRSQTKIGDDNALHLAVRASNLMMIDSILDLDIDPHCRETKQWLFTSPNARGTLPFFEVRNCEFPDRVLDFLLLLPQQQHEDKKLHQTHDNTNTDSNHDNNDDLDSNNNNNNDLSSSDWKSRMRFPLSEVMAFTTNFLALMKDLICKPHLARGKKWIKRFISEWLISPSSHDDQTTSQHQQQHQHQPIVSVDLGQNLQKSHVIFSLIQDLMVNEGMSQSTLLMNPGQEQQQAEQSIQHANSENFFQVRNEIFELLFNGLCLHFDNLLREPASNKKDGDGASSINLVIENRNNFLQELLIVIIRSVLKTPKEEDEPFNFKNLDLLLRYLERIKSEEINNNKQKNSSQHHQEQQHHQLPNFFSSLNDTASFGELEEKCLPGNLDLRQQDFQKRKQIQRAEEEAVRLLNDTLPYWVRIQSRMNEEQRRKHLNPPSVAYEIASSCSKSTTEYHGALALKLMKKFTIEELPLLVLYSTDEQNTENGVCGDDDDGETLHSSYRALNRFLCSIDASSGSEDTVLHALADHRPIKNYEKVSQKVIDFAKFLFDGEYRPSERPNRKHSDDDDDDVLLLPLYAASSNGELPIHRAAKSRNVQLMKLFCNFDKELRERHDRIEKQKQQHQQQDHHHDINNNKKDSESSSTATKLIDARTFCDERETALHIVASFVMSETDLQILNAVADDLGADASVVNGQGRAVNVAEVRAAAETLMLQKKLKEMSMNTSKLRKNDEDSHSSWQTGDLSVFNRAAAVVPRASATSCASRRKQTHNLRGTLEANESKPNVWMMSENTAKEEQSQEGTDEEKKEGKNPWGFLIKQKMLNESSF